MERTRALAYHNMVNRKDEKKDLPEGPQTWPINITKQPTPRQTTAPYTHTYIHLPYNAGLLPGLSVLERTVPGGMGCVFRVLGVTLLSGILGVLSVSALSSVRFRRRSHRLGESTQHRESGSWVLNRVRQAWNLASRLLSFEAST